MSQNNCKSWDKVLRLAQHSYNIAKHESLNYWPHEIVFREKSEDPSSFPPREHFLVVSSCWIRKYRTLGSRLNLINSSITYFLSPDHALSHPSVAIAPPQDFKPFVTIFTWAVTNLVFAAKLFWWHFFATPTVLKLKIKTCAWKVGFQFFLQLLEHQTC